jgi:hypothetical protein
MLFGKLDVLLGNLNHAEVFLEPAPNLFFYPNIVDTVGYKMALLASNNPLEASTNSVEDASTLSMAMGARELVEKAALGESRGSRCEIRNSSCCWLFPCDSWIVVVLDVGSFIWRGIIKLSSASRTCAHLGSWIGWIHLILLFLCHKILTQKFNSIVFIDMSGIWKERQEIVVFGTFL